MQIPEKPTGLPMLKQEFTLVQDRMHGEVDFMHGMISRLYGLMQWLLGPMFTLNLGVAGPLFNVIRPKPATV